MRPKVPKTRKLHKVKKPYKNSPKRGLTPKKQTVAKASTTRLKGVERVLPTLRVIHSPKKVRAWLGFSLAELGRELGKRTGRVRAFDKAAVWNWENGSPVSADVQNAYAILIANKLTALFGRIIAVRLVVNSPWDISAWTQCAQCAQWFELKRRTQKRCATCCRGDP